MSSLFPTQIAYKPTGVAGVAQVSSVVIGRSSGSFEGVGFGAGGRPDYVQTVQINMGDPVGDGTFTQRGSVTFNVDDLASLQLSPSVPTRISLTFKEVSVCDNGTNRKMIILATAPY